MKNGSWILYKKRYYCFKSGNYIGIVQKIYEGKQFRWLILEGCEPPEETVLKQLLHQWGEYINTLEEGQRMITEHLLELKLTDKLLQ